MLDVATCHTLLGVLRYTAPFGYFSEVADHHIGSPRVWKVDDGAGFAFVSLDFGPSLCELVGQMPTV